MNNLLEQVYNQSFKDELIKISGLTSEELNKQSAFKGREIFKRLNPIRGKSPLSKILLNNKGGGFSPRISQVKGLEVRKPLSKNISQMEGLIGSAPQSTNIKQVKGLTRYELTKTAMPPNAELVKNIQRSILKGPHANKEIVKRFLHSTTGINIGNLQRSKSSLVSKNFFPIIKK